MKNHTSATKIAGVVAASLIPMQMNGNSPTTPVSLYFHVPFCTRKCDYCHFYVLPNKPEYHDQLMHGFELEWKLRRPLLEGKKIVSIYFGGGTPALIGPKAIATLLSWAAPLLEPNCEITLETNPENTSKQLMKEYAAIGINRASIGLQSLDPQLLQLLSRTHNADQGKQAVHNTYDAGISNITVDLMYDLPDQSLAHWQKTLQEAAKLPIKHLSLYNLTIEPHTVFYKNRESLQRRVPDEEISATMYRNAVQILEEHGLKQYEISAFANPGFKSLHNTGYWLGRPFLGFGPSAFSYWNQKRFRNISNLNRYVQLLEEHHDPVDFSEELEPAARRRELLAIALRLREGVDLIHFEKTFGPLDPLTLETLKRLVKEQFLIQKENTLYLTQHGILFYDTVATELI